jgi:hypothetical protein
LATGLLATGLLATGLLATGLLAAACFEIALFVPAEPAKSSLATLAFFKVLIRDFFWIDIVAPAL